MKFLHNKKMSGWRGGYVMMTATLCFIAVSLTIIFGIVSPAIAQIKNASRSFVSRESYFLAEAGIENAIYQLKNGHSAQSSITLNGQTVNVDVSTDSGETLLVATGEKDNTERKVEAHLVGDTGMTFNYAVFSGNGGFNISGGSDIIGSVYSNGDIIGSGGSTISEDATSATLVAPSVNQTNGTAFPPPYSINFGSNVAPQDFAQSFQVSTTTAVTAVRLYMKKSTTAWMNNITLRIMNHNSSTGNPGSTNITTVTIPYTSVPTVYGYVAVSLTSPPTLSPGTTYWLVLDTGSTYGANYSIGASSATYANGLAKTGTYNSSWSNTSPSGLDAYFDIIVGGDPGIVSGLSSIGGDAWAYQVTNSTVSGTIYCQIGSGNNKNCDTTRTDPSSVGYPISDQNITTWKEGVTAAISPAISGGWTYNGNMTINYNGTTTSNLTKVVGNLTVSCSSYPANFGNLWVTGNLTINSGCDFNASQVKVDGNLVVQYSDTEMAALDVTGNLTIGSGGVLTAGPIKVGTDVTVGSNSLVLKGTLWVVGKMTVQSGATVRLHSSYGTQTGVIVLDGRLDLGGGGTFAGSGQAGSFPLLITLSTCPSGAGCSGSNAIQMSGGAGAVLLVAQNGTISMSGGTAAKALIGKQVILSGGAEVHYDEDLLDLDFESGPAGAYNIEFWKEVQ